MGNVPQLFCIVRVDPAKNFPVEEGLREIPSLAERSLIGSANRARDSRETRLTHDAQHFLMLAPVL
jgi:hypothetical protein